MKKYSILFLFFFLLCAADAFAAKRYWVATAHAKWNSTANWSATSGGSSGASVPGVNDTAYFNSGGNFDDTLDVNISVKRLEIAATYTATIVQGAQTVTIGSGGAVLSGGTFSGGSASIAVNGILTISGTAFTSTSGTLSVSGNYTLSSGSFSHNNGTFLVNGSAARAYSGNTTFYTLEFNAPANGTTYSISSTFTTTNFKVSGTHQTTFLGGGTVDVKGNITVTNSYITFSTGITVTVTGTSSQHFYGNSIAGGFAFPNLVINKSADTLHLHDYIYISGDWTYTAGVLDAGTSNVIFAESPTVTGTFSLYHMQFSASSAHNCLLSISGSITVNGDLNITYSNSGGYARMLGGTIHAKGNVAVNNTTNATFIAGGTPTIISIDGTGSQTLTGSTVLGAGRFPSITINKASGTLTLNNIIAVGGNWTYTSGTVSAGSSTVYFTEAKTISGSHTLNNVWFSAASTQTQNIASGTILTVTGTLGFGGAGALTLNSGGIYAQGNISITNSNYVGGGSTTVTINGTGDQNLTGNSSLGGRLPKVVINKPSGTLYLISGIGSGGNWTYTAGTVDPGTSTVVFYNTKTISGSMTFNNVVFTSSPVATFTISPSTSLTVNGTLTTDGSWSFTLDSGAVYVNGDIDLNNTAGAASGTATLHITGTGDQHIYGGTSGTTSLPNLEINKSSGTLYLHNNIVSRGNWTYTAGTLDAGTSTVTFYFSKVITGSHSLYNVIFLGGSALNTYTIAGGTTLTILGTMTISSNSIQPLNISGGTVYAKGNININSNINGGGGTATIVINGSGDQTLTGSGTINQGRLPKVTIDKTSGTLYLSSIISIVGDWTYTQGTVSSGTSTVATCTALYLDGQASGSTTTMPFYNVYVYLGLVTLTGNLDVDNDLTNTASIAPGANSIFIGRDFNCAGGFTYATSTVTFDGSGYQHFTAGTTPLNFYNFALNKSSKSLTLLKAVKVNNAMTLTEGHLVTTSTNYLELVDNATLTGGNDSAYVDGPMLKTGNDAFTFPLGDTTLNDTAYHPLAMTAPSGVTDQFEAEYFPVQYTVGDSLVDSLASVSQVEHWKLERMSGSSSVTVTIGWNRNSNDIEDLNGLRVGNWDGTKWLDNGAASVSVNMFSGNIAASLATTFTTNIAYVTVAHQKTSVPYALLKKKLDGGYYQAINGRLFFRFDEEYNDADQKLRFNVYDDQHVLVTSDALQPVGLQPLVYYGDNRYKMNTLHCQFSPSGALPNGYYTLEVINEKNEHWYLRFKQSSSVTLTNCYTPPSSQ